MSLPNDDAVVGRDVAGSSEQLAKHTSSRPVWCPMSAQNERSQPLGGAAKILAPRRDPSRQVAPFLQRGHTVI